MNTESWWAIAGLVMIIADIIFGSFFILFTGAGALLTALLIWIGVLPDPTWQWVVFAASSTLGLVLFRSKLVSSFGKGSKNSYDEHKGARVEVIESIPVHGLGRVKYRGAEWQARSADENIIEAGTTVIIQKADGIILEVMPEV